MAQPLGGVFVGRKMILLALGNGGGALRTSLFLSNRGGEQILAYKCTLGLYVHVTTLMPPSHLTLPNNQSIFLKLSKASSIKAEASNYLNAPTRTCSGDCRVGFG